MDQWLYRTNTPTITAGLYTAGNQMGNLITFSGVAVPIRGSRLGGATLIDAGKQSASTELWLFQASPTLVSADHAAFDITDANLVLAGPFAVVTFTTWFASVSNSVSFGVPTYLSAGGFSAAGGNDTYGVLVTRGTPTPVSTTDLTLNTYWVG